MKVLNAFAKLSDILVFCLTKFLEKLWLKERIIYLCNVSPLKFDTI